MNISMRIKKQLKTIKKQKGKPYEYYLNAQNVIKKFYSENDLNEDEMVRRYNKLYNDSDNNPVGYNVLILSLFTSLLASWLQSYIFGHESSKYNLIEFFNVNINNIIDFTSRYHNYVLSLILFIVLILAFVIFPLSFFTIAIIIVYKINFQQNKLSIQLGQYEMALIDEILVSKYKVQNDITHKIHYKIRRL